MDLTPNFALGKPLVGENYDVTVFNNNMDTVDTTLKNHKDRLDGFDTAEDGHFSTSPQRCKISVTNTQTVASGTPEQLDLATSTVDYDAAVPMADKANDCIKIKQAGWYVVTMRVCWNNSSVAGDRFTIIRKGTTVLAEDYRRAASATNTVITLNTGPVLLAVNDQINGFISQNSGGNLATEVLAGSSAWLSVHWFAS